MKKKRRKYPKKTDIERNRREDAWDFRDSFPRWVVPRLEYFVGDLFSHPKELTMEEWRDVLNEMIEGFTIILTNEYHFEPEKKPQADRALELFTKYFYHLNN